jgi:hypothetical protein
VFFEQVNCALLFELRCDVDGSPAHDRAAETRDEEGNEVARPAHAAILDLAYQAATPEQWRRICALIEGTTVEEINGRPERA